MMRRFFASAVWGQCAIGALWSSSGVPWILCMKLKAYSECNHVGNGRRAEMQVSILYFSLREAYDLYCDYSTRADMRQPDSAFQPHTTSVAKPLSACDTSNVKVGVQHSTLTPSVAKPLSVSDRSNVKLIGPSA